MSYRLALAVCLVCLLPACATISESTCRTKNWQDLGYRDAMKGLESRSQALAGACGDYGLTFDASEYRIGWEEGLDEFCSSDQGYEFGLHGGNYRGTCPGTLGAIFLQSYQSGRMVGELERRIDALEREIFDVEHQLDNPGLSREDYYYWRSRLSELMGERRGYEQQLARVRRH